MKIYIVRVYRATAGQVFDHATIVRARDAEQAKQVVIRDRIEVAAYGLHQGNGFRIQEFDPEGDAEILDILEPVALDGREINDRLVAVGPVA